LCIGPHYCVSVDCCFDLNRCFAVKVHRDLKTANVLVSNAHYSQLPMPDVSRWWLLRSVVAKLTDFGESRSSAVKTRCHVTKTLSPNVVRGSPIYQAPEILNGPHSGIEIKHYKRMDIWSFAMVVFELMNPHSYAYRTEIAQSPQFQTVEEFLRKEHSRHILPLFPDRFQQLREGPWCPLKKVFDMCAVYDPSSRPTASDIMKTLVVEHVNITNLDRSHEVTRGAGKGDARNACTFLALIVADKLLHGVREDKSVMDKQLARMVSDAIDKFPATFNKQRRIDELYGVSDAYKVPYNANVCNEMNIDYAIFSQAAKDKVTAVDELRLALHSLQNLRGRSAAVYVIPPLTILVCSLQPGSFCAADTHILPKRCGGDDSHGAVITKRATYTALTAISEWLVRRMCTGKTVVHELAVLSTPRELQEDDTDTPDVRSMPDPSIVHPHDASSSSSSSNNNCMHLSQVSSSSTNLPYGISRATTPTLLWTLWLAAAKDVVLVTDASGCHRSPAAVAPCRMCRVRMCQMRQMPCSHIRRNVINHGQTTTMERLTRTVQEFPLS